MSRTAKRKTRKTFRRRRHYKFLVSHSRRHLPSWSVQVLVGHTSNKLDFLPDEGQEPMWSAIVAETRSWTRKRVLKKARMIIDGLEEDGLASVELVIEDTDPDDDRPAR